ncbi:hypothetical protein [Chitinophaga japonensis]|uniref:Uncharacterized protein n=1 Tax=Chitinophaga japonensis TaxID=104662 RepID=A0A562T4L5_CHIJA|nr:hypothetical protein [Chitinophaga japonensis]TWI87950.1 hypothetical protein LX66_2024 [Chitinophaga japonensis]
MIYKIDAKKLQFEFIQELKNDRTVAPMIEDNKTAGYKIRIIQRGEHLFYQQGDRAFICDIQIRDNILFTDSIKKRDDGTTITDEEKAIIFERIESYFKNYQKIDIRLYP